MSRKSGWSTPRLYPQGNKYGHQHWQTRGTHRKRSATKPQIPYPPLISLSTLLQAKCVILPCYPSISGSLISDCYRYIAGRIIDGTVTDREHAAGWCRLRMRIEQEDSPPLRSHANHTTDQISGIEKWSPCSTAPRIWSIVIRVFFSTVFKKRLICTAFGLVIKFISQTNIFSYKAFMLSVINIVKICIMITLTSV